MENLVGSLNMGGDHSYTLLDAFLFLLVVLFYGNCVWLLILCIVIRTKKYYIPSTFQTKFYQSHRVDQRAIRPGDHIYTWTPSFIYSHHGICVDKNTVIHFTGAEDGISASSDSLFSRRFWPSKPIPVPQCDDVPGCGERHGSGVVRSCIKCFREGRSLYRYQYGLGTYEYMLKLRDGTCTIASSDPASEVIDRANRLLKRGFGTYDVGLNNCEDFALYCKTRNTWISSKQIFSWLNIVVGFIFSLALSRFICWPVVAFVAAPLYHSLTLYIVELNVQRG